jgi:uncharacterized membrane protein
MPAWLWAVYAFLATLLFVVVLLRRRGQESAKSA